MGMGHNQTNSEPDLSPIVSVDSEGNSTSTHNRVTEGHTNYFTYTYELYGNYDFSINDIHNFQTVAGFSIGESKGGNISATNEDVPFNSWAYADVSASYRKCTSANFWFLAVCKQKLILLFKTSLRL